ncbi:hypothetical protein BD770DRAFT_393215 [Pilaira anomala]|nr:hypothetical protein BD770DRAFT_393215 [Pilaira anomala]
MRGVYNLQQHPYCIAIHLGKFDCIAALSSTINRSFSERKLKEIKKKLCITYNKQKTKILGYGKNDQTLDEDEILVNDFRDRLFHIFEKGKSNWDPNDLFLMRAVSEYLYLIIKELFDLHELPMDNFGLCHYIFIVPCEWRYEIREALLRPIFIQSGLIKDDDGSDRLSFTSDVEAFFYYTQALDSDASKLLKKHEYGIMSIISAAGEDNEAENTEATIKFVLFQAENGVSGIPDPMLFPRVISSITLPISADSIKKGIRFYLKSNLFPDNDTSIDDQNKVINNITEYIYSDKAEEKEHVAFKDKKERYSRNELYNGQNDDYQDEWIVEEESNSHKKRIPLNDEFWVDDDYYQDEWIKEGEENVGKNEYYKPYYENNIYREKYEDDIYKEGFVEKDDIYKEKYIEGYENDIYEEEYISKGSQTIFGKYSRDLNVIQDPSMKPFIKVKDDWGLNVSQTKFIESITISSIYTEIGYSSILDTINVLTSINRKNQYIYFSIVSSPGKNKVFSEWLKQILGSTIYPLNKILTSCICMGKEETIKLIDGAFLNAFEVIQNSDMYSRPCIVQYKDNQFSFSSVFQNSKTDAVINIDILYTRFILTCSLLNEKGIVEDIFYTDDFTDRKCLPSLESIYKLLDMAPTNSIAKEQPKSFIENYLPSHVNCSSNVQYLSEAKNVIDNFDMKLDHLFSTKEGRIITLTQKQKDTRFILLIFLVYLSKIIQEKQPKSISSDTNIGYVISVDQMLLKRANTTQDGFKELIYTTKLIKREDSSKKLKVMIRGEALLPIFQRHFGLSKLPIKSYFVLAQLHETYIQMTLNQVVTFPFSEEEEQESVVIQDEIIPIQNLYDALCSNAWDYIIHNTNVINLCDIHTKSNNIYKYFDLLTVETQALFKINLKGYISNNVLAKDSNIQIDDIKNIRLNGICSCHIHLSCGDIMDIAFKPTLQTIASTILASFINKCHFGNYYYTSIEHLFTIIYFNRNAKLHTILSNALEEEMMNFCEEQQIDVRPCNITSDLILQQQLQPKLNHRPFLLDVFQLGSLYQVYSESYSFTITFSGDDGYRREEGSNSYFYKDKITDTESIQCKDVVFPFIKKGDKMNNSVINKTFYLKNIGAGYYYDYFTICILKCDSGTGLEYLAQFELDIKHDTYTKGSYIPVMISMEPKHYSSSLLFSVKEINYDTKARKVNLVEVRESMNLVRC